jgi:hypothetical protein
MGGSSGLEIFLLDVLAHFIHRIKTSEDHFPPLEITLALAKNAKRIAPRKRRISPA